MTSEILSIPEEHLLEVCRIIRAGIKAQKKVTAEVKEHLLEWCDEEEEYIRSAGIDD